MKTILVTGGAGFIGSNFIHYMLRTYTDITLINVDKLTYAGNLENLKGLENDARLIFKKIDICDTAAVRAVFFENDIDWVINFAAESHVDRSISDPEVFIRTNVLGAAALLGAAHDSWKNSSGGYKQGTKFVQVSTDEVYGSLGAEGFFVETTPLDPHSPYSASKAAADLVVKSYFDTFGLPINITRCSNNYGPFQFPEKLIPLMICNALEHKDLPVYGDGMQIRDWLYVDDHCKAIDLVARKGVPGEVYNIGGHNERPNIAIVKTILQYLRDNADNAVSETLIRYVEDRKGHDRRYGIDPQKIGDALGWLPETPFEEGIVKTIQWYLDHRSWTEEILSGDYQKYYEEQYGRRSSAQG